ncbi:MAG TPA: replication initiation protein [Pseudolabrys sp.]
MEKLSVSHLPELRDSLIPQSTKTTGCAFYPHKTAMSQSYEVWRDLRRFVVDPAIGEINEHGDEGGFFVAYEGLREGKAFTKIKFTLSKSAARDNRDAVLQKKARRARTFTAPTGAPGPFYEPTDAVLGQLRAIAPGWDRQALLAQYR